MVKLEEITKEEMDEIKKKIERLGINVEICKI